MENCKVLIHLGYPKTASSWFQSKFFKNENLGFTNPINPNSIAGDTDLMKFFVECDDFSFDPELIYKHYEPLLTKNKTKNLVLVLSNELLSARLSYTNHQKLIADRLYQVFPYAKIFFFVREQNSVIFSQYNQIVKGRYDKSLHNFLDDALDPYNCNSRRLRISSYKYDLLIKCYQEKFGKENVLVLPFELFKIQSKETLQKIIDFVNAKVKIDDLDKMLSEKKIVNSSLKAGTLGLKYRMNKVLYYPNPQHSDFSQQKMQQLICNRLAKTLQFIIPKKIHEQEELKMKQLIKSRVGDIFRESNQRSSELIGINLKDFGYDC